MNSPEAAIDIDTARLTTRVAQSDEIDELGHVNNAVYVSWIQDAATQHWFAVAGPEIVDPYVWVCLRHEIDYGLPVMEGEEVQIRTWLGKLSGAKFDRHVDIRKVGSKKSSVRSVTTWVLLDRGTRRPRKIGQDILSTFGLSEEQFKKKKAV